jgi:methionyl-tRNA formyltransferase
VKLAARELGLPVIDPERLRDALPTLREAGADLFAVASYGKILRASVLELPALGALNVHPSLLPLYRGATPLQAQLRDGVSRGGVTIILMDEGMDTGDVVLQEPSEIGPSETYGQLHDRFAGIGARLLAEACRQAAAGTLRRTPQAGLAGEDEILRTLTRPLGKDDLTIDWGWSAKRVVDHVRSLSPAPGARARLPMLAPENGVQATVKVLEAHQAGGAIPGELCVRCGDGAWVAIDRLVPPNRKALGGRDYLAGAAAAGTIR